MTCQLAGGAFMTYAFHNLQLFGGKKKRFLIKATIFIHKNMDFFSKCKKWLAAESASTKYMAGVLKVKKAQAKNLLCHLLVSSETT